MNFTCVPLGSFVTLREGQGRKHASKALSDRWFKGLTNWRLSAWVFGQVSVTGLSQPLFGW